MLIWKSQEEMNIFQSHRLNTTAVTHYFWHAFHFKSLAFCNNIDRRIANLAN